MIDPHFVILGACFSLVGSVRYSVQTLRGRTRPNRVTWFLWAAAPIIGFLAQLDDGVGLPAVLTLSVGVGPALILASSFLGADAYWRIGRFDIGCGLVSVAALVVWLSLDDPTLAVVFSVLADLTGGIPTLVKIWRYPETERASVFAFAAVNGAITLLTIDHWAVSVWAFPVYIAVLGTSFAALVVLRRRASTRPSRPMSPGRAPWAP